MRFYALITLVVMFSARAWAQSSPEMTPRETISYYEKYLEAKPDAKIPEEVYRLSPEQQEKWFRDRVEKFRSGRLGTDLSEPSSGRTRFSQYLEAHTNENLHGTLDHPEGVPAASALEKVMDESPGIAAGITVTDTGGNSHPFTKPGLKSAYNYVLPHGELKEFFTALKVGFGRTDLTMTDKEMFDRVNTMDAAELSLALAKVESSLHLRRVLKPGLAERAKQVGSDYAKQTIQEAKDCDWRRNAGADCPKEKLPSVDLVKEEAEWLLDYYKNRSENRFKKLTVDRLNEGADQVQSNPAEGAISQSEKIGGTKVDKILDAKENLSANRSTAGEGSATVLRYSPTELLPNFEKIKREDLDPNGAALEGFGKQQSNNSALTVFSKLSAEVKAAVEASMPKPWEIRPDWDQLSPTEQNNFQDNWDKQVEDEINQKLMSVFINYKKGLPSIQINGKTVSVEVKDLDDLMAVAERAGGECASPMSICVYDPNQGKLVPGMTYYGGGYDAYVKVLDEMVKREAVQAVNDPRAFENNPAGLFNAIDLLPGEEEYRKQITVEFRQRLETFRRVLLAQRENMQALGAMGKELPPIPSEAELVLALTKGKQVFGYGTGREGDVLRNRRLSTGKKDPPVTKLNVGPQGKEFEEAPLTPSGFDARAQEAIPLPPALPGQTGVGAAPSDPRPISKEPELDPLTGKPRIAVFPR